MKISSGEAKCIAMLIFVKAIIETKNRIKNGEVDATGTVIKDNSDENTHKTIEAYLLELKSRIETLIEKDIMQKDKAGSKKLSAKILLLHARTNGLLDKKEFDLDLLTIRLLYDVVNRKNTSKRIKEIIDESEIKYLQDLVSTLYDTSIEYIRQYIHIIKTSSRIIQEIEC